MSGIYLVQTAAAKPLTARRLRQRLVKPAILQPFDRVEEVDGPNFSGAVIHHGTLGSSGAVQDGGASALLVLGACWRGGGSLCLPADTCRRLRQHPFSDEPLMEGSYLLAFFDERQGTVVVENDPFGLYPVYYCRDPEGNLLVASELKCLAPHLPAEVDREAVLEILRFGSVISDRTVIQGIRRLPPNHRLHFARGELTVRRLRQCVFTRDRLPDAQKREALRDAFEGHLRRFSGLGTVSASLSGGMDSRIAVAAARRVGLEVQAFSMGEPGSLECQVAARFARSQGIPCQIHQFDGRDFSRWFEQAILLTEGRCPPGHMHFMDGMLTGHFPRQPMLHGLIGDAVMGGDLDMEVEGRLSPVQWREKALALMRSFVYWPPGSLNRTLAPALFSSFGETRQRVADHLMRRIDFTGGYSDLLWFRYHFRVFGFTIPCLTSQILPWTDPIVPYLDADVFRLCAGFDRREMADRQLQLRWALENYPEIAVVERVKDGVLLPLQGADPRRYTAGFQRLQQINAAKYYLCRLSGGRINLRRRETYPYYDQWLRRWKSVRDFVEGIVLSDECLDRGLWRREGLQALIADLRIGRDVWNALSSILMIEILLRQLNGSDREMADRYETLDLHRHTDLQRRPLSAGHAGFHPISAPAGD